MLKPFWMVPASSLLVFSLNAQQPQAAAPAATPVASAGSPAAPNVPSSPATAVPAVNPLKPTPEILAKAKKTYGYDCVMCHGENGNGKGELVADMKLTLKDYTSPESLKDMSDPELYTVIKNGKGQMTGEGDRAKPNDMWALVLLLRSFSTK